MIGIITNTIKALYWKPLLIIFLMHWYLNSYGQNQLIAIVIGMLIFYYFLTTASSHHQEHENYKNLTDYLENFKECNFQIVNHESVFDNKTLQVINERGNNREILVYKVNKGSSEKSPSGFKVFSSFINEPTRIFIKDDPEDLSLLQKFILYHELGHSDWNSSSVYMEKQFLKYNTLTLRVFTLFCVFLVFMSYDTYDLTSIFLLLIPLIIILKFNYYLLSSDAFKMMDEVNADKFALIHFAMDYPDDLDKAIELYPRKVLQIQDHSNDEKKLRIDNFNILAQKIKSCNHSVLQRNDLLPPMIMTLIFLFTSCNYLPTIQANVLYSILAFLLLMSVTISIYKRKTALIYKSENTEKNNRILSSS